MGNKKAKKAQKAKKAKKAGVLGSSISKATPEQPKNTPVAGPSTTRRGAALQSTDHSQTAEELFQNISLDSKDATLAQLTAEQPSALTVAPLTAEQLNVLTVAPLTAEQPNVLTVAPLTAEQPSALTVAPLTAEQPSALTEATTTSPEQMAARNRPRSGLKVDPDEELAMWNAIVRDLQKCKEIQKKQQVIGAKILAMDAELARKLIPSVDELDALDSLNREQMKLAAEEWSMLNEEPVDLIKNMEILAALRTASGQEPERVLPPTTKNRKPKAPKPTELDGAADSPGPSPSVATSSSTRLKGTSTARSGSVASVRDEKEKVKVEEGAEGIKGPVAERGAKFHVGAEVAYKQAKQREDGSQWIQCQIVGIQDLGNNKKRYEVRDPEPDEGGPAQNYKASANVLIAIPAADAALPDYPEGKHVLAKYPDTTTFYRAVVMGKTEQGLCRLKFEDDQNQEMAMDRRFVLDAMNK